MGRDRTRILVVDDEEIVRESLSAWLEKDGYTLATAPDGETALERIRRERWSILLVDLKMPGIDGLQLLEQARKVQPDAASIIMTAYAAVDTAVAAMKIGAFDYLVKPFDPEELSLMIQKIVTQQALVRENVLLRRVLKRGHRFRDLVGKSPAMRAVFDLARAAARSDSTILIHGESGTGKEFLARAVHAESPRSQARFVSVSCSALTETLLESELFGHERGAPARRPGQIEMAKGGTLFLDEIGALSQKLQADLLRVIEDRCVFRAGGTEAVPVDARIIAASNRNLQQAVAEGVFRGDLLDRLTVIPISLPPLRDRLEDLPWLVDQLLEELGAETGRHADGISAGAMALLMSHTWPGNVRELRTLLERAIVVASGRVVEASDLGLHKAVGVLHGGGLASLEEVEKHHISRVLQETGGNISQAARTLGIDRATLYNKLKKYQLRKDGEIEGEPEGGLQAQSPPRGQPRPVERD